MDIILLSFVLGAVILAVAQWIVRTLTNWIDRRRRRLGRRLRVVILIDRARASRRRRCFWGDILKSPSYDLRHRIKLHLLSISDDLNRKRNPALTLFSPDKTDVIVVNWDAINGDPVYGSDRSFCFLQHYRPDMLDWLSQGGLIIVESQGASWSPVQMSYDCITSMFDNSSVVVCSDMWTLGDRAGLHPASSKNPLVSGLQDADLELSPSGLWARKPWFPRKYLEANIQSLRNARRHQQYLYRGWFTKWTDDWTPVVAPVGHELLPPNTSGETGVNVSEQYAIALYRPVHRAGQSGRPASDTGFVVLTTMFIASSELLHFVANIFTLPDRHSENH